MITTNPNGIPAVPLAERLAAQARAARWNYLARVEALALDSLAHELSALLLALKVMA